jgi:hypothetical protein
MFGLVLFVFLKSVVDGLVMTPHTATTSMFALVGFGVVYFLTSDRGFSSVVLAVNSAFLILGLTTAAAGFVVAAGVRRKR